MDLLSPEPGLVIWSGLTFLILFALLRKFAWKPILDSIRTRENKIEQALLAAQRANDEYKKVEEAKAQMTAEARLERDTLLREARAMKDSIVEEAKTAAAAEANKIMEGARAQIEKEKAEAVKELKQQVAALSVEIASRIMIEELKGEGRQEKLIEKYLSESNFN